MPNDFANFISDVRNDTFQYKCTRIRRVDPRLNLRYSLLKELILFFKLLKICPQSRNRCVSSSSRRKEVMISCLDFLIRLFIQFTLLSINVLISLMFKEEDEDADRRSGMSEENHRQHMTAYEN